MTRSGSGQGAGRRQCGTRWSAGRRSVRVVRPRKPATAGRARLKGRSRKPAHDGAYTPRSQGACKGAVAQRPGASRRSIPLIRETEKRESVAALHQTRGSAALA